MNRKKLRDYLKRRQIKIMKRLQEDNIQGIQPDKITGHERVVSKLKNKFPAPENFSIRDNPDSTVEFFNKIIEDIGNKLEIEVMLNMESIESVTVDAIMYVLALMYSSKARDGSKSFKFGGRFPKKESLHAVFKDVGFIDFIQSSKSTIQKKTNSIRIQYGTTLVKSVRKEICDFVIAHHNVTRAQIHFVNILLTELMGNTVEHATCDTNPLKNSWYLYVGHKNNKTEFVFLDTGLGIPETVNKNYREKAKFLISDKTLIATTLKGKYRSRTTEATRGKGLPKIFSYCNKEIKDFTLISGKGMIVHKRKGIDLTSSFQGTLYYWTIDEDSF